MNNAKNFGLLEEGRVLAFTMWQPSTSGTSVLKQKFLSHIGNL
jgi:hypothetical protein